MNAVVEFDPIKDKSYAAARLGRDVVDFLAWLELGGTRPRTLDQYERDLARGALMYPGKSVRDLTDGDALQIAKQFKPGERRVRVAAWRSFLKWAIRTRRADRNPFDVLPTLRRAPKRVFDIFTDAEILLLTSLPIEDGALMQLMFDAGLRKGDCRQLQWKHFRPDPMPGQLALLDGKGGKDRLVTLTLDAARKLTELGTLNGLRRGSYVAPAFSDASRFALFLHRSQRQAVLGLCSLDAEVGEQSCQRLRGLPIGLPPVEERATTFGGRVGYADVPAERCGEDLKRGFLDLSYVDPLTVGRLRRVADDPNAVGVALDADGAVRVKDASEVGERCFSHSPILPGGGDANE